MATLYGIRKCMAKFYDKALPCFSCLSLLMSVIQLTFKPYKTVCLTISSKIFIEHLQMMLALKMVELEINFSQTARAMIQAIQYLRRD